MKKLHVLLMFGGESPEHEVSVRSAQNVYAALDDAKYDVSLCYIDKAGRFWLVDSVGGAHIGRPQLVAQLGHHQFLLIPDMTPLRPDVVFPVLHGKNGEDGTIQGLLELLHIPYVGPNPLGAALTMHKDATKRIVEQAGLRVVPWRTWHISQPKPAYTDVRTTLGGVVFVKPSRAGSSVGVSKVTGSHEFDQALRLAARYDDTVLIEKAINGREIEVAILGNETPSASLPGEIIPGSEFYDYDDKYATDSEAQVAVPAKLEDAVVRTLQHEAIAAYHATVGQGMARVDFLLDEDGVSYINEINSIPGFTNISLYPRAFRAQGMSYSTLVDTLIDLALRHNKV